MTTIRLSVPETAEHGEIIELRAMIQHDMESGFRFGPRGGMIERDIISKFECFYNGTLIFSSDFHPGVAANPLIKFNARATASGAFEFVWTDDNGQRWSDSAQIEII